MFTSSFYEKMRREVEHMEDMQIYEAIEEYAKEGEKLELIRVMAQELQARYKEYE